jgi:hypothetical protein
MKLLHLHLKDGYGNKNTLVARLKDGSIRWIFYRGTSSSGTGLSLSNIQFYDIVNGNMRWDNNKSLPVENLPNETKEEFKQRVINMLNNSTDKVDKIINTEVTFK